MRTTLGRTLVLFNHDFDALATRRLASEWPQATAGFDLFSSAGQWRLPFLNLERWARWLALRARAQGWTAVVTSHEQFGILTAALLAERMGWPCPSVQAVLACQHKAYARTVLQRVCPEANVAHRVIDPRQPHTLQGLSYPAFVKPVKAAFSVLAREVPNEAALLEHTRLSAWDRQVIRWLVAPVQRVVRQRLPEAAPVEALLAETPVHAQQYNLDGYVYDGEVRRLGVVDAVMYPGTQAFMRFDYPSRLPPAVIEQATEVARRFLTAIGFNQGLFNMEFFHDEATGHIKVIEFNPRMAAQFSDLYERVDGLSLHAVAFALAHGQDPIQWVRQSPTAGVASSFVYRVFSPSRPHGPTPLQRQVLAAAYPDAICLPLPASSAAMARDLKWMGSHRYGLLNLGGRDEDDLNRRCEFASHLLGWPAPLAGNLHTPNRIHSPTYSLLRKSP